MRLRFSVRLPAAIPAFLCAFLGAVAAYGLTGGVPASAQTYENDWLAAPPRPAASPQRSPAPGPAQTSSSQTASARSTRIAREVLALYDGTQERAPDRTRIHRYLELPLNHLGLTVTYWDLAKGMPDADLVKRHRAIVTWFGESIAEPGSYLDWAARTAGQGTRFIVLEATGGGPGGADLAKVNAFMKSIGVEIGARWVGSAEAGRILTRDAAMLDFEGKLDDPLPGYTVIEPKGSAVKSHLVLESRATRLAPQVRSSVVVTGPGGGYAALGFVRHFDPATRRLSWMLNPFAFLSAALGLEQGPIPDTTTISGRRLYFSHIDGDGWNAPSAAAPQPRSAAEAVLAELIAPTPDLPVSVGLIASDADPAHGRGEAAIDVARRILERPQVEAASHTRTNPFRWAFFESYDRERELARVITRRATTLRSSEHEATVLARFAGRDYAMQSDRAFQALGNGMPRAHMQSPFDLDAEVAGALAAMQQLAPAGKTPALYLWSGDMRPFEAAIRATRTAGARNLNGGDARLDADYPSIMYLAPIGRPVGRERQIYAVNSNENAYTNGWRGPFDGQARLTETWDNTDAPRRLKGMNLYYHMYSGTRPESLGALKRLIETARAAHIAPVSAGHYAAIADAFHEIETQRLGQLKWRIANRGALQTVRFDAAADLYVDIRQSQGVLGFTHHAKSLYVALDDAVAEAVVALTSSKPEPRRQERPYLVESRWLLSKLKVATCGFEAEAQGYGAGEMTWAGVRPGAYTVSFVSERTDFEALAEASVDQSGELKFALNGNAIGGGRLKVACARTSPIRTGTVPR